uniref:Uncharacterized protein n=1 Tax=Oryza rufipogon TaxID=4529 RepID=A0A0E0N191_ORYRU
MPTSPSTNATSRSRATHAPSRPRPNQIGIAAVHRRIGAGADPKPTTRQTKKKRPHRTDAEMGRDPTHAFRPRLRSAKPPRIGLRVPSSPPTHHRSPPAASDELRLLIDGS